MTKGRETYRDSFGPRPGEFEVISYYPQRYLQKQISLALGIRAGAFGGQLSSAYLNVGVAPDLGELGEETRGGDMTCGT